MFKLSNLSSLKLNSRLICYSLAGMAKLGVHKEIPSARQLSPQERNGGETAPRFLARQLRAQWKNSDGTPPKFTSE